MCTGIRDLPGFSGGHSFSIWDHPWVIGHIPTWPLLLPESPSSPIDHCPLPHYPPWAIPHCSLPSVPIMYVSKPRLGCSLSRNGKHFKLYLTATLFVGITLALDTGAFCRSALAVLSLNFWDLDKMFDNTDVG